MGDMAGQWTIMVFMNAQSRLEPKSFANFAEMARVGSTPDVNIVVQYGRPQRHYSNKFGAWSKTLRFRVEKGMEPVETNAIMDIGDVDMAAASALGDFVSWALERYPADHYCLVVWGHGWGWRMRDAVSPSDATETQREREPQTAWVSYDRSAQEALAKVLGGRRLDIIGFDACLMATIESVYGMRRVARVFVGSQDMSPDTGWDYANWLSPVIGSPASHDPPGMTSRIFDSFSHRYRSRDYVTLSVLSLAEIDSVARALDRFAEAAIRWLPASIDIFRSARQRCREYGGMFKVHSIDLCSFLDHVSGAAHADANLTAVAMTATNHLRSAVTQNFAAAKSKEFLGSNGLNIYFPSTRVAFMADPCRDGYRHGERGLPAEFVENHAWANFLDAYWHALDDAASRTRSPQPE